MNPASHCFAPGSLITSAWSAAAGSRGRRPVSGGGSAMQSSRNRAYDRRPVV